MAFLNTTIMRNILLLLTLTTFIQTTSGQKQRLRFDLTVGQSYYHSAQAASSITQDLNGQKMTIDATISGKMVFKIAGKKDSVYVMNVTYQQLDITMKLPNGNMTFSSEKKDENDIFSNILAAIKGKTFLVKMTDVGNVVEVQNLDSIFESLFENFPQLSVVQKQQIKGQLLQAYGENAFRGNFEMVTAIYTNSPVEKGNSWTIKTKLESGMAAVLTTTFELKDRSENYNLIIGKGQIETADKDAYIQVNGMPTKYNLTGTMNSTLKVDNKTGWLLESKINQSIAGNAEIKDNPKLPGGLIIPMSIETEMTYSSE